MRIFEIEDQANLNTGTFASPLTDSEIELIGWRWNAMSDRWERGEYALTVEHHNPGGYTLRRYPERNFIETIS